MTLHRYAQFGSTAEGCIVCEPDTFSFKLSEEDEYLVMCSDGVWDYYIHRKTKGPDLEKMTKKLKQQLKECVSPNGPHSSLATRHVLLVAYCASRIAHHSLHGVWVGEMTTRVPPAFVAFVAFVLDKHVFIFVCVRMTF